MKLLLCSDFSGVGYRFLEDIIKNPKGLNCLFIGYAEEDDNELESGGARRLKEKGINLISLTKDYKFLDKIDIVFVRGGNTTRLVDKLREFNQYEKVESLVRTQNILFIGSSAGAILTGTDTSWTLEAEPYDEDMIAKYGKDALKGYGWIDKLIFPHASKYRMCYGSEMENEEDVFRTIDNECYPAYLKDKEKYSQDEYVKIDNNQAYYVTDEEKRMFTFNWDSIPIKVK